MATRKQLMALARGRAIRMKKIKSKKTYRRRIRKTTNFQFMKGMKAILRALGIFNGIMTAITIAPRIKVALRQLFYGDEMNTARMREISANMQKEILMLGIKDNSIHHDFAELNKAIHSLDYYRGVSDKENQNIETENVMTIFKKIMDKYNKLVDNI